MSDKGLGRVFLKENGCSFQTEGLPDGTSGLIIPGPGPFEFAAAAVALGVRGTPLAAEVAPTSLPLIPETELDAAGGPPIFRLHVSGMSVSIGGQAKAHQLIQNTDIQRVRSTCAHPHRERNIPSSLSNGAAAVLAHLGRSASYTSPPATVTRRPWFFTAARLSSEFFIIFKLSSAPINIDPTLPLAAAAARRGSKSLGGASSGALRFPAHSAGADADAGTDEDASWRGGMAVSGAQGRAGSVRDVGHLLMPRLVLTDDDGASLLGLGRTERSQLGLSPTDARLDGALSSWWV